MNRWLYFFVTFCGLALMLFVGFQLLPISSATADAGCSTQLTKTALVQPLNTDPSFFYITLVIPPSTMPIGLRTNYRM